MKVSTNIEHIKNIHRAAGYNEDTTYPILNRYLKYRRKIAKELINHNDNDKRGEQLQTLFKTINEDIKHILGI